ncbi:L-threonylcarbamoyladenylate synthase [uncultured Peptoniphilus sp.]|uniref:L-threonylcarbamoyladenylate synthase n=1 Tax=uncultured Peptoniphilus sp. TaxID=254354 RepID=UPI00262CCFD5|nr:L-threonylcarbamoyladenylate synthase [uncultured Peptoniphilus sp.]
MKTEIIKFKGNAKDKTYLRKISDTLREGGLVVLPTETVYGLGGNGLNKRACKKIYEAKGRPSDNPLILHIAENSQLDALVAEIPDVAKKCMEKFWPGPLTIIFKRSEIVPDEATGGLETVAIREPSNEIAHAILKAVDFPVAAPSANLSGRPSPTKVEHVIEDLNGRVDIIVDGGHSVVGIESTVLDVTVDPPMILRPGKITLEDLREIDENITIDNATIDAKSGKIPKSPGQKYRHYAPRAEAICFGGRLDKLVNEIKKNIKENKGKKIAVLATDETYNEYKNLNIKLLINLGSRENLEDVAANLFDALRRCDDENVDIIFAEGFELRGIGLSIMNRLLKACSGKVVMRI